MREHEDRSTPSLPLSHKCLTPMSVPTGGGNRADPLGDHGGSVFLMGEKNENPRLRIQNDAARIICDPTMLIQHGIERWMRSPRFFGVLHDPSMNVQY